MLRPELMGVVDSLLGGGAKHVTLDEVSEAIGATAITLEEIELVFSELETRGVAVGDDDVPAASAHLREVLDTARRLRRELGRAPSPSEIAECSGLQLRDVRLALLAVTILQR